MVSVQFSADSATNRRSIVSINCLLRDDPFPFPIIPKQEDKYGSCFALPSAARIEIILGEAPRYTHLEFTVQKRITRTKIWLGFKHLQSDQNSLSDFPS